MTACRGVSRALHSRYRGLFSPRNAPTIRAYCTLFSFTGGIILVTAGSVFCSVISRHPVSGGHLMHTPPLPLAVLVIVIGVALIITSIITVWRYGMDDGDDTLEDDDDGLHFCCDDQLDHQHRQHLQELQHQQLLLQRYLEHQLHHQAPNTAATHANYNQAAPMQQSLNATNSNTSCYHVHQESRNAAESVNTPCLGEHCCNENNRCNLSNVESNRRVNIERERNKVLNSSASGTQWKKDLIPKRNEGHLDLIHKPKSKEPASKRSTHVPFQPASLKMGRNNSATLVMSSPSSESCWSPILSKGQSATPFSSAAAGQLKVSSVIVANKNAVRVVLDGS